MAPTSPRPRYSKGEFARRGDEIYEREVLPRLTSEDEGKYALIDIESGDYEIDRDEIAASDRLFTRRPDAQVWFRQVGSRYARRRFVLRPRAALLKGVPRELLVARFVALGEEIRREAIRKGTAIDGDWTGD